MKQGEITYKYIKTISIQQLDFHRDFVSSINQGLRKPLNITRGQCCKRLLRLVFTIIFLKSSVATSVDKFNTLMLVFTLNIEHFSFKP